MRFAGSVIVPVSAYRAALSVLVYLVHSLNG